MKRKKTKRVSIIPEAVKVCRKRFFDVPFSMGDKELDGQ